MAAKKSVSYGDLRFETQTAARTHLKTMLNRYDPGDRVSATDAVVLTAALALHPEASEKIGAGIKDFSVRTADFATKCFWVNRIDGSTVRFSYNACV